jgi:hypothetical protein
MLRAVTNDRHLHWDEVLSEVLFAYRSSVDSSTGFFPYEMLYGRAPRLPGHLVIGEFLASRQLPSRYLSSLQQLLKRLWDEANTNLNVIDCYDEYSSP